MHQTSLKCDYCCVNSVGHCCGRRFIYQRNQTPTREEDTILLCIAPHPPAPREDVEKCFGKKFFML